MQRHSGATTPLRNTIRDAISEVPLAAADLAALDHGGAKLSADVRTHPDWFRRFAEEELAPGSGPFMFCARAWGLLFHPTIVALLDGEKREALRERAASAAERARGWAENRRRDAGWMEQNGYSREQADHARADADRQEAEARRRVSVFASYPRPAMSVDRPRTRERRPVHRQRRHVARSTSSADSGSDSDEDAEAPAKQCAAPWCRRRVTIHGRRYCDSERCQRARAAERQRKHRQHRQGDPVAERERQQREDARIAGYDEFAPPREHSLSFLWRYGFAEGEDPGEQEAITRFRRGTPTMELVA